MFDHVTIRAADRLASERFYDTVLRPLAIDQSYRTNAFSQWRDFTLAGADADNPPTRRLHVAFVAPSREHVDEFWRVGTEAGYPDDGPRACGRSTPMTTTERSCSIPMATAPRP